MTIKVMTYNINYSRRASNENGFGFYDFYNRAKTIYQIIKEHDPDILMIQELHNDYVTEFKNTLYNYNFFIAKQNARNGITNIAIGVKNTLYELDDLEFGEYNLNQYNENLENTVYLHHKKTNTLYLSVHFPMDLDARKKSSELLHLLTNKYKYAIIAGDFNSFPNMWGYQQMTQINAYCSTYSLSEFALYKSNNNIATKSFIPYPYDYVPKDALSMVGKLDHILGKNVISYGDVIVDDTCIENTNILPSDHMPIICNIFNI
jgi:endonuclease/exonuclease/phosphatase family metal-dependent hydrolase